MPECWIALGGNLGSVAETFHRALALLAETPGIAVRAVSSFHRTIPVGSLAGDPYLNAAAGLETDLPPAELLGRLHDVEHRLGRVRTGHWHPRPIDLDLLLYGDAIVHSPALTVPHPHLWYRRFVLDPLVEIAADVVHPEQRCTIQQLRERLLRRPFVCALAGGTETLRTRCRRAIQQAFPEAGCPEWSPTGPEPALLLSLGEPLPAHVPRQFLIDIANPPGNTAPEAAACEAVRAALGTIPPPEHPVPHPLRIAVVSDTHGHLEFTRQAVELIRQRDVAAVLHCGDVGSPAIVPLFADWPTHFVFGNVDYDAGALDRAIRQARQTTHGEFGEIELAGVKIALLHSHDRSRFDAAISAGGYDLVCYGHTHQAEQHVAGRTLVLNPGALYRANPRSFAIVELPDLLVEFVAVS